MAQARQFRDRFLKREEKLLGAGATPSLAAVRRSTDKSSATDFRPAFSIDADRILHSRAFTRYIDKTQVFSRHDNDHITRRVIHIQLVSKIARTIGRVLELNEDLIEAIALGHDIGHCPFGHAGERILNSLCRDHGIGRFQHNLQSFHVLERVEKGGIGLNLSLQVLDGIVCHDGETHILDLRPEPARGFADLDDLVARKRLDGDPTPANPMTMEGCLVKLCDTISYIGRDMEDAVQIRLSPRSSIPAGVAEVLGDTNGKIVYRLVESLIENSLGRDALSYDPHVGEALGALKRFNYENIYLNPRIRKGEEKIKDAFSLVFERLHRDLEAGREDSPIHEFLEGMDGSYREATGTAEKIRDYIAGMTDDFFIYTFNRLFVPEKLPREF